MPACDKTYISRELTHFVGRSLRKAGEQKQYALFRDILRGRVLKGGMSAQDPTIDPQFRITPIRDIRDDFVQGKICFCDIPESAFAIHMAKYSGFGIAFLKSFLTKKGAQPVIYVAFDSGVKFEPTISLLRQLAGSRKKFFAQLELLWKITDKLPPESEFSDFLLQRIFGYLKFFRSELPEDHAENYYMEREWRIVGEELAFSLDDVSRVVLPRAYCTQFGNDFPHYCGQMTPAD